METFASLVRLVRVGTVAGVGVVALGLVTACPAPGITAAQVDAIPVQVTALRKEEVAKLSTYQHVDTSAGIVRVPVERAMELVVRDWAKRPTEKVSKEVKVVIPAAPKPGAKPEDAAAALAKAGEQLFAAKACVACHSVADMTPRAGPSLKGIFGRTEELADGTKITADEAYITESMKNPNAKVVKGFAPVMPQLGLTDPEVGALIAYLKTVK